MKKHLLSILSFATAILVLFSGCGALFEEEVPSPQPSSPSPASSETKTNSMQLGNPGGDQWTILVYLCGTDLETTGGCASANLVEMAGALQSEQVKVVVQTGGTESWSVEGIDPDALQRWEIIPESIELVDTQPLANMGDGETLGSFLSWGVQTYPADKYALVLWNHGGGSVAGIAADELFDHDTLNLKELASGVAAANAQFEMIGFDACLMSTMETAAALSPYARYMVASQEWEPGTGWDYNAWLSHLVENPTATGLDVGKVICDSFYNKCVQNEVESLATLAVTDLSRVPSLVSAFDKMAAEMKGFTDSPEKLRPLSQALVRAENYGGNNDNEGYTNMVDLGDMALCAEGVLSSTGESVLDALFEAVPYHVEGSGRRKSNGLSVFVPLLAVPEEMDAYARLAAVSGEYLRFLEGLYDWKVPSGVVVNQPVASGQSGQTSPSSSSSSASSSSQPDQTQQADIPEMAEIQMESVTLAQALNAQDYTVECTTELTQDGYVLLSVNQGADIISSIAYNLFYLDEENNAVNFLGSDFDVNSNEDGTQYWDNFRNVWPVINGNTCSILALDYDENYILYTIPVKLNGKETNLRMIYHLDKATYEVVGAWDGIDGETGMSSRDVRRLVDGDKVEFMFASADLESGETDMFSFGGFTVNGTPTVEEVPLFDGVFYYQYEITDIFGNVYESDFAILTSRNGEITVEMEIE